MNQNEHKIQQVLQETLNPYGIEAQVNLTQKQINIVLSRTIGDQIVYSQIQAAVEEQLNQLLTELDFLTEIDKVKIWGRANSIHTSKWQAHYSVDYEGKLVLEKLEQSRALTSKSPSSSVSKSPLSSVTSSGEGKQLHFYIGLIVIVYIFAAFLANISSYEPISEPVSEPVLESVPESASEPVLESDNDGLDEARSVAERAGIGSTIDSTEEIIRACVVILQDQGKSYSQAYNYCTR